ncbi:MAG TPA: type II toxin-antitoxin system PemK/MazF family toxin [archaeon]|nr:type II toxin-antitoxin system PemK/MazF family toxin [archaeon]
MKQQDLVWVRLPFSSMEESRIRPAVIVSNDDYNKKSMDVIVCAITSNLVSKNHSIFIDSKNLSAGNLPIKSRIRADKIMQIEKSLIIKPFARLDNRTFDSLVKEIIKLLQRRI